MAKNKDKRNEVLMTFHNFISKYDLEGDINEVAEKIKAIPEKLKEAYPLNDFLNHAHRFSIDADSEYEYGSNDSHDVYHIQAYRWETDDEMKARLAKNRKERAAAKVRADNKEKAKVQRQKTLYENLKKKFGK